MPEAPSLTDMCVQLEKKAEQHIGRLLLRGDPLIGLVRDGTLSVHDVVQFTLYAGLVRNYADVNVGLGEAAATVAELSASAIYVQVKGKENYERVQMVGGIVKERLGKPRKYEA